MKRFVDVRGQELGGNFAWFDTVKDLFEEFDGEAVFYDWDDFHESLSFANIDGDETEAATRYLNLCPDWVFVSKSQADKSVADTISRSIADTVDEAIVKAALEEYSKKHENKSPNWEICPDCGADVKAKTDSKHNVVECSKKCGWWSHN